MTKAMLSKKRTTKTAHTDLPIRIDAEKGEVVAVCDPADDGLELIRSAAHTLTVRAFTLLEAGPRGSVRLVLRPKESSSEADLEALARILGEELASQRIRHQTSMNNRSLHESVVEHGVLLAKQPVLPSPPQALPAPAPGVGAAIDPTVSRAPLEEGPRAAADPKVPGRAHWIVRDGWAGERAEDFFERGHLLLKSGRLEAARVEFSLGARQGDSAERACARYALLARLRGRIPRARASGPRLSIVGLGMNPPDSVTLETLAALSRAQVLFDNIGVGRGGVSEFLRSFAGESRALRFDGLAEKERVRRSEEAIFSELRLGRSAAFVTRGNALVMGAFAVAFIMRCRREGIPYEVHGALSTVDLLTAFAIERLGETAPEYAMFTSDGFLAAAPAKMRGPLALFPYGRLGRAEVKTVERSLLRARPRQQPCLVFGPHEESPPERVALTAFARRYPKIHVSLAMYLPGRGWDGRGFPGPNGDPQLLLAGLGVFPERTATWETVFELSRCGIVFSRAGASAERALQSLLPELRVERFRGADGVLRALERGQRVALLCPGGPALWDEAARGLLESARARGRAVRVLAAVSPLDCLVAHLEESFGESFAGAKVVSAQWLRKDSIDPEIPLVVCWEGVGAPAGPMARAYPAGSKCLVLDAGRGEVLERVLDGLPWSELEPGSAVWVPPRRGLPSRTAE